MNYCICSLAELPVASEEDTFQNPYTANTVWQRKTICNQTKLAEATIWSKDLYVSSQLEDKDTFEMWWVWVQYKPFFNYLANMGIDNVYYTSAADRKKK